MAYALSTTKRKFHRLLDSISDSSNPSPSKRHHGNASTNTLPATLKSSQKKARSPRPQSSYASSLSIRSPYRAEILRLSSKSSIDKSTDGSNKTPSFTPWDRGQFLDRLKTFRHVDKWMSKPERINEVQWARRGWRCVGKERVGCSACGKELVIQLEADDCATNDDEEEDEGWRKAAQDQLVETYLEKITVEHEEGCLWRIRGCDATIYRLPLTHPPTSLKAFRTRYESLIAMASELPASVSTPEGIDVSAVATSWISLLDTSTSADSLTTEAPPEAPNIQALSLAVFGWEAETEHISGLATCNACFRRLGLWLYNPRNIAGELNKETISDRLDVVGEHRDYCPWVNTISQNGGGLTSTKLGGALSELSNLAGWQLLRQVAQNASHSKRDLTPPPTLTDTGGGDAAIEHLSEVSKRPIGDSATRDAKDKERWTKLKRLKQVFRVKTLKNRGKKI